MPRVAAALGPLIALALLGSSAYAGAGGGSSGFSGGGGGGGHSGGSSGSGGSNLGTGGSLLLLAITFGGLIFFSVIGTWWYRRRRQARRERVETASLEAAQDDAVFSVAAVNAAAADLYVACQVAWDARDQARLAELVGDDLLVEWRRRLDDFAAKGWHNRVSVHARPEVEYLGIVNREDDADDRVVVRISARQDDYVEGPGGAVTLKQGAGRRTVSVAEWWTLGRRAGGWIVVSIEQDNEGKHHLEEEIVAVPDADDERLHDEATVEVAQADAAPPGVATADIADLDFDGDARAAALDLSLADARFAPAVLEVAARRAVAGWAEAVDGEDAPLLAVATAEVSGQLLHPGGSERQRMVVRGPRVRRLRIAALDAAAQPARMTVEVEVSGRRYVEDRDTAAVVSGSRDREITFTERWTLAIDGPPENPWRIVAAG